MNEIRLSKASTAVLARMRQRPDGEYLPVGQQEQKACDRLVKFGLAEWVLGGRPSDYFGLPHPVYRITDAGRRQAS
jgi:hypothetical protein